MEVGPINYYPRVSPSEDDGKRKGGLILFLRLPMILLRDMVDVCELYWLLRVLFLNFRQTAVSHVLFQYYVTCKLYAKPTRGEPFLTLFDRTDSDSPIEMLGNGQ